jgi:hypothetical protein
MNCIWVALIKDMICDKQFDCESCEFDKVLRNLCSKKKEDNSWQDNHERDLFENLFKQVQSETFDEKLIYLKNQLVLKNIFGNVYYLGINPILMHLLDDYDYVQQPEKKEIKKGQLIFTLEGRWGKKHFLSPTDFTIIERINFSRFRLQKWYAIIMINDIDQDGIQLSKDDWDAKKMSTILVLNDGFRNKPEIGQSMMDGGLKVKFLYQYFGNNKYIELLNRVFI